MSDSTKIEWTDRTWNPLRGCSRISPGCLNCYAERIAVRFSEPGYQFHTFAERTPKPHWTGKVELIEHKLLEPLSWRKPCRCFVNSMSDLFHERVPDEWIDRIFAVMALCPQITFQCLTKRADRMEQYFSELDFRQEMVGISAEDQSGIDRFTARRHPRWRLPLPNVHIGVSVENQEQAKRIPHLLRTPAAVRFLSCEPLLGPLKLKFMRNKCLRCCDMPERFTDNPNGSFKSGSPLRDEARQSVWCPACGFFYDEKSEIKWVIVGGESGPGARPCNIEWIRGIVRQCKAAGVPVFVKQLGSKPALGVYGHGPLAKYFYKDKKGGDPAEWPEDLRVREFPKGVTK